MSLQTIAAAAATFLVTVPLAGACGAETVQIQTARLEVRYEPATASFSVMSRDRAQTFLKEGKLNGKGGTARVVDVMDRTFGKGH